MLWPSDGRVHRHRKLHTFISEHMGSGDEFTVFDLPNGLEPACDLLRLHQENVRINALLGMRFWCPHQTGGCKTQALDAWAESTPPMASGNENPAAIEAEFKGPKGREWLMKWLPARAHDNGLFLIFSNGVGLDDNEVRTGNATILDPYGDVLAETWKADDAMIVADLDPAVREMCTGWRWIQSRRPQLYRLLAEATGNERDIRTVRFSKALWNESQKA